MSCRFFYICMRYNLHMDKQAFSQRLLKALSLTASIALFLVVVAASFPSILTMELSRELDAEAVEKGLSPFPVTVDPKRKIIAESSEVNQLLESPDSPLQASALSAGNVAHLVFVWIASAIGNSSAYQSMASVGSGTGTRFVTITPGMRREQVANAFGSVLGWTPAQKKAFLTPAPGHLLPLFEGSFVEGTYTVTKQTTPLMAQAFVNDRFSEEILAHYSTSTAAVVPLEQALIIASLIEREAGGADDMRLISGIIWNRLFLGMKLQIDATVQYAKASAVTGHGWWPRIVPSTDMARKSPYNTYRNVGLPPGPIASPSVASVLAALNPKSTSCIFYFHDSRQNFHCSETYADHVTLLKQYYGRGR